MTKTVGISLIVLKKGLLRGRRRVAHRDELCQIGEELLVVTGQVAARLVDPIVLDLKATEKLLQRKANEPLRDKPQRG